MLTRPFNGTFHFQNLYYTFLTRVDIGIILSEYVRQRKTNTTYTWNLKNKWTKSNINTDKGLVVTRGEEVAGEGDMGEGDHLYGDSWQLDSLWRQCTQMSNYGKKSACHAGDPGSIPGSGGSPGEGNDYPLQDYCLEIPMHRGACWATVHRVAKSWTPLSD